MYHRGNYQEQHGLFKWDQLSWFSSSNLLLSHRLHKNMQSWDKRVTASSPKEFKDKWETFYTVCVLYSVSITITEAETEKTSESSWAHQMYTHIACIHCLTLRCHLCSSSASTVSLCSLHVCWVRVPQASPILKIPAKERRAAPSSLLEESQQRL